jgi:hypothetical protein
MLVLLMEKIRHGCTTFRLKISEAELFGAWEIAGLISQPDLSMRMLSTELLMI